jgi:hypothetical protein
MINMFAVFDIVFIRAVLRFATALRVQPASFSGPFQSHFVAHPTHWVQVREK